MLPGCTCLLLPAALSSSQLHFWALCAPLSQPAPALAAGSKGRLHLWKQHHSADACCARPQMRRKAWRESTQDPVKAVPMCTCNTPGFYSASPHYNTNNYNTILLWKCQTFTHSGFFNCSSIMAKDPKWESLELDSTLSEEMILNSILKNLRKGHVRFTLSLPLKLRFSFRAREHLGAERSSKIPVEVHVGGAG